MLELPKTSSLKTDPSSLPLSVYFFLLIIRNCYYLAETAYIFAQTKHSKIMDLYLFSVTYLEDIFDCVYWEPRCGLTASFPVPMNVHYIPKSWQDLELMKIAVSWENPHLYYYDPRVISPRMGYGELLAFRHALFRAKQKDDRIIVVHGQDARSRLLLYSIVCTIDADIYHIDATPKEYLSAGLTQQNGDAESQVPALFDIDDTTQEMALKLMGTEKLVTLEERQRYREIWSRWSGKDVGNSPLRTTLDGEIIQ